MAVIEAAGRVFILKRSSASRPLGQWNDDDFDVLANGEVVGRIFKANAEPVGGRPSGTRSFYFLSTVRAAPCALGRRTDAQRSPRH
jgi:hypothetical protein